MKMKNTYICILVLFTILGCQKADPLPEVTDPKEAILGKWKIAHLGNGSQLYPIENPNSYEEYPPDSVLLVKLYEDRSTVQADYWIDNSSLFKRNTYLIYESPDYIDTLIVVEQYHFEFINYNTLRLDLENMTAINYTSVYRRID